MANHKSSLKRIRQEEKRRLHNRYYAKTMRNTCLLYTSVGKKMGDINTRLLEEELSQHPLIENVECYRTPGCKIGIEAVSYTHLRMGRRQTYRISHSECG